MNNKIDDILKKAQLAYNNHEYKHAVELLESVYLNRKNFHNNYLLFKGFIKNHQWDLAVNVANDFVLDYIQNDNYFFQYFECLLRSGNILNGFILFNKLKSYLNGFEQDCLEQKLKHYSDYLNEEQRQIKNEVVKSLRYLGGYPIYKQQYVLQNLKLLSPEELLSNSTSALVDSNVPCIVRLSIIDILRKVAQEKVTVLNLFMDPVEVNLGKLQGIEDMQILREIKNRILSSDKIAEALKPKVIHEMKLKLIVMYSELDKLDRETICKIVFESGEKSSEIQKIENIISNEIEKVNEFKNY